MDTVQFILLHHERLYAQIEELFGRLTDDQMRQRPQPRMTSIAWLFWHMTCCEDLLNPLIAGQPLVLDEGGWFQRLNLPGRDAGIGMTDAEVGALSARVDIAALRAYQKAVGCGTEEMVRGLRPDELDDIPESARLDRLFQDSSVFGPNARCVRQIYAGKTKGWFLGHLALTHPREHFAQAILVKKMLGLPSGRS